GTRSRTQLINARMGQPREYGLWVGWGRGVRVTGWSAGTSGCSRCSRSPGTGRPRGGHRRGLVLVLVLLLLRLRLGPPRPGELERVEEHVDVVAAHEVLGAQRGHLVEPVADDVDPALPLALQVGDVEGELAAGVLLLELDRLARRGLPLDPLDEPLLVALE